MCICNMFLRYYTLYIYNVYKRRYRDMFWNNLFIFFIFTFAFDLQVITFFKITFLVYPLRLYTFSTFIYAVFHNKNAPNNTINTHLRQQPSTGGSSKKHLPAKIFNGKIWRCWNNYYICIIGSRDPIKLFRKPLRCAVLDLPLGGFSVLKHTQWIRTQKIWQCNSRWKRWELKTGLQRFAENILHGDIMILWGWRRNWRSHKIRNRKTERDM